MASDLKISVVIPAYGPSPHLDKVLTGLLEQTVAADEVIVSHSGPALSKKPPALVKLLHCPDRLYAGPARNHGAYQAKGELLVFIDADVVPAPDFLAQVQAHYQEGRFLIGAIGVAESGGYWGMSNWCMEFAAIAPRNNVNEVAIHGASANMCVAAKDFHEVGGFDDVEISEDSLLFLKLESQLGLERWFIGNAVVHHNNVPGLLHTLRHQFKYGQASAAYRQQHLRDWYLERPLSTLAYGAGLGRFARVAQRLYRDNPKNLRYLPGVLVASCAWSAGFGLRANNKPE